MQVKITPSEIAGTVTAPASKSVMQRACAAALLRGGKVMLHHYGKSRDDATALDILKQLGAAVTIIDDDVLEIISENFPEKIKSKVIDCGESGLSARMFTAIVALSADMIQITGTGTLLQRPFHFFEKTFPQLGVSVISSNGYLPLTIQGRMQAKDITVDGSLSSQYLTGLLFAFSALNESAHIHVDKLNSKPYIDLTLEVMKDFGLSVPENKNYKTFVFKKSKIQSPTFGTKSKIQNPKSIIHYAIEGDWSSAAVLLVAAAINGAIKVKGLKPDSLQADKKILDVLRQCGCPIAIHEQDITVAKNPLKPFHFDAMDCPDLFPPLAALALFCNGTSSIKGLHRLIHKESNRAESITEMCRKFGGTVFIEDDEMIIEGEKPLHAATINSFSDHRIAMAAAIIAMNIRGESVIDDAACVQKSYPGFWKDMDRLGANIQYG